MGFFQPNENVLWHFDFRVSAQYHMHVLYKFKGLFGILDREGGLRVCGSTHNDK